MNYTHLFSIQWDDSYNDPDYSIPHTLRPWLQEHPEQKERLAQHLEWIAKSIRCGYMPFGELPQPGFKELMKGDSAP